MFLTLKPEVQRKFNWKILSVLKRATLLLLTPTMLFSCSPVHERTEQKQESTIFSIPYSNINADTLLDLTPEQEAAFVALNSIQVQGQHLYSTFSGIFHDCYPPDTSFIISRSELLIAMEELLTRYYTDISTEQRTKLAAEAVLAQEEYLVLQCNGYSNESVDNSNLHLPTSGSWILPKVLNRRDVILEW